MGTRDNLLKAAADLLREVGFEGMTTAQIAKRAGVAEGTIYRHFANKEGLIEAVFETTWARLNEHMEASLPPRTDPVARLERFFAVTLEGLATVLSECQSLAQQEQLYYTAKMQGCLTLPKGLDNYVALLEDAIRLAQAVGHARPDVDAKIAALFIFSGGSTVMDLYTDLHGGPGIGLATPYVLEQLDRMTKNLLLTEGAR